MAAYGKSGSVYDVEKLRFYAFQHPYVCTFMEELQKGGVTGLLTLANQRWIRDRPGYKDSTLPFVKPAMGPFFQYRYSPTDVVDKEYPQFNVDFEVHGAYAQYNWELFFHIPLFIATRLMQDQRHEEAMRWFHYIFNPMTDDKHLVPQRYWNFRVFRDSGVPERIQELLWTLQDPNADTKKKEDLEAEIDDWREHPFQPHRIARGRPGAYMKTVVMKYLDNFIAWADKLFRRDTIESINEATQLYILAANLLGARPQRVPTPAEVKPEKLTYKELRAQLDNFLNAAVLVENIIVHSPFTFGGGGNGASNGSEGLYGLASLAFCIPHNDKLLGYWDTVADRLFKIRHCMNIEGVVRELPLFEPPIDPALLVRATAMGLDLGQVLDDLAAPLPHYRFAFMLQKAREFCEELKQLGNLLLSALEKKDAEKLAQIRATYEKDFLKAVLEVKKKQVKEAEETKAGLEKAKEIAETRSQHYEAISNRLPEEKQFLDKQAESVVLQIASQMAAFVGTSVAAAVPEVTVAARAMAPGVDTKVMSGQKIATIANLVSTYLGWLGQIASLEGTTASYKGGLIRAQQDRDLQIKLANLEKVQLEKQIAAAGIRQQIAENELANHEKQIEQASQVEEFLREKFTNQELYSWMLSQVSAVYFQSYKLAYGLAKRAERVYRHELGITDSAFVQFGAWDSLHKGLLAGEKLSLDLRRLEHAYLEGNKREHEITKHVSLALLNPETLLELRETGTCEFSMPELLFDLDFPGHYYRQIKSVRLTVPCVTGPYTGVNAKLTLLKNRTRKTASAAKKENYPYDLNSPNGDVRFLENLVGIQSIATSSGQNDAGLFELNFRDERFLPFEGAGVISRWRLDLPTAYRHFDYDTISDVILHVSYTARDGGDAFKAVVTDHVEDAINKWLDELAEKEKGLPRLFSLRQEFPNAFHRFFNPASGSPQCAEFEVTPQHFPYFLSGKTLTLSGVYVYLKPTGEEAINTDGLMMTVKVNESEGTVSDTDNAWGKAYNNLKEGALYLSGSPIGQWTIEAGPPDLAKKDLAKEHLEDILLLLKYTVT
jgi:mevalonate kinase